MSFFIASSPHAHNRRSTPDLMKWVALCALPGLIAQSYFFGWGTLIQLIMAITLALSLEALVMLLRKRSPARALRDNSALVTAWLLAVAIPPLAPWWIIAIGLVFAIVIAKHLYGGLGQNPFNPAMVAYVVLLISFPVQMTSWNEPSMLQEIGQTVGREATTFGDTLSLIFSGLTLDGSSLQQVRAGIDGITTATPLDAFKTGLRAGATPSEILQQPIFEGLAGLGWQWVNLAYLLGGLVLIKQRIIQWHIPAGFLGALAVLSSLFALFAPGETASPVLHLLSGATMLGAFFIATDPVSASTTVKGRLIFGAIIGTLVFVIRSWGGYPDGVAFAVLLANMCVPLIDYYTKPRTYGH
ncbi:electron transport complex subunit RsxD [Vibrio navarrensis]|uniref:electron transport complex subunit RsxD n=1 Tax=Vibrio navarrensis TaxID=29495 RepID=UPI0015593C7E|nr:electron transport complex subunit RsxD [Vibrio navarrensis]MBE3664682.1 electron transport complex subunit RsxD [Vibrio navarrensis]MBE4572784.1 electron transport complex subunit RsxD [Vibrio navarrensis]MBE4576684.1 electron transport complex subunit RsxD [Vibrio navarrensis]MBE4580375.1 electron transport complex subunit RsxD [Vibrio navarrensis]MBE4583529.1 electron transport complex subunit RsxD [Vibrio navarrensis]